MISLYTNCLASIWKWHTCMHNSSFGACQRQLWGFSVYWRRIYGIAQWGWAIVVKVAIVVDALIGYLPPYKGFEVLCWHSLMSIPCVAVLRWYHTMRDASFSFANNVSLVSRHGEVTSYITAQSTDMCPQNTMVKLTWSAHLCIWTLSVTGAMLIREYVRAELYKCLFCGGTQIQYKTSSWPLPSINWSIPWMSILLALVQPTPIIYNDIG